MLREYKLVKIHGCKKAMKYFKKLRKDVIVRIKV